MLKRQNSIKHDQKGFTLLEVLVAIVTLSIGLLAVASMQTTAMLGNTSAMNRSRALGLAEEMVDRIRVNSGDNPNIYDCIDTNNSATTAVPATGACATSGRPSQEPAMGDYDQWQTRLQASGLPNAFGTVVITMDSPITKAVTVTVTVTWGVGATGSATLTTIMETWLT